MTKLNSKERARTAKLSRKKGASFELEVAQEFEKAIYPKGNGEVKRVPLSGGWSRMMACDILAFRKVKDEHTKKFRLVQDENWKIHVEAKIRRSLDMLGIWTGNVDTPIHWFLDAQKKSSLPTVLVFRQSLITTSLFLMEAKNFSRVLPTLPHEITQIKLVGHELYLMGKLEDFLKIYAERWR